MIFPSNSNFLQKKITKTKKFLRNDHYFIDFSPTNSDLFTIKTLNEKINKNAIFFTIVNYDQIMQKIKVKK